MAENGIERGAAEDASGVPVTPTDIEASRKPPSEPSDRSGEAAGDDGSGAAGRPSGGSGDGPGTPDRSDAG
jgi:hypothetical protein